MMLPNHAVLVLKVTGYLSMAMLWASCGQSATEKNKAAEVQANAVFARQDRGQEQRDSIADYKKFEAESTAKIVANRRMIVDFKVRIMTGEKAMKARYQKRLDILEKKNNNLKSRLEQYSAGGTGKWSTFKSEWDHDMDGLTRSLHVLTEDDTFHNTKIQ